ncbi:MAG: hypothetical protein CMJ18_03965 [Phycisphaeraceae bacterium]|nr:hypothetical protein [Phycisphaeraceae bacterium]
MHRPRLETLVIFATLLAGAMLFAFPFLWMVGTSFKVNRELAIDRVRLLPAPPRPEPRTPFVDDRQFRSPSRPDGVPEAVWDEALPRLQAQAAQRIDAWNPSLGLSHVDVEPVEGDSYRREMIEGLLSAAAERISDVARGAAVAAERAARGLADGAPAAARLEDDLRPASIRTGVTALEDQCGRIWDDRMLERTFDLCYRRICLGACRVRSSDFRVHAWPDGGKWTVVNGDAQLTDRRTASTRHQEASIDFSDERTAVFRLAARPPVEADRIDRVFVAFRADETWARVRFRVLRDGRWYRTTETLNLHDKDWVETRLRWPTADPDPMVRRTHLWLTEAGAAAPDDPAMAVEMIVTHNRRLGAWRDKILNHYRTVFREMPIGRFIMTSLALSILNVVLMIFSCTLCGYAFARLSWPGRDLCFVVMLATMMIPAQVTMIPSFLIFKQLGWYNTLLPLWVPAAFGSPFFIFLLRQFLKTVPTDLEDAARIDGCGFLRIYWHLMLPLVLPTIAIIAVYTFMGTWNNFMGPLIYVNDERLFPLALGLFKFELTSGGDVGLMMAASFVMTLPVILLFFFVQRYFIQGVTLTGMKG